VVYAMVDVITVSSLLGQTRVWRYGELKVRFWNDAMKAFFPGAKDDPYLVLIEDAVETVEYWDGPGSWIGKAAAFAVALVTGDDEALGENRIVDLRSGVTREPPGGR